MASNALKALSSWLCSLALALIVCIRVEANKRLSNCAVSISYYVGWDSGSSNCGSSCNICSSCTFVLPFSFSFSRLACFVALSCWCCLANSFHCWVVVSSYCFHDSSATSVVASSFPLLLVVILLVGSTLNFFGSGYGTSSWSFALLLFVNPKFFLTNFQATRWHMSGINSIGCWIWLLCCAQTLSIFW